MVFGKTSTHDSDPSEREDFIDLDDDSNNASEQHREEKDNKPLLQEVTIIGAAKSKNAGGAKVWICKHCKQQFTSSYTRIHIHLFGPPVGKKADIKRCHALLQDREKYQTLFNKVKQAENAGISKSLKTSVIVKKATSSKNPIEESFGVMERSLVDLKITRCLCANGIPFNVLRNPDFLEAVSAINKAPAGYRPHSSEKARTVLLDECVRDVEKDLTPIKDTWYSQGVSIVSDGWSNIKHNPLINVLAVNSRGAMFMYAEDFSGVEKTGVEIAEFLISIIENVGPTNVLSVVTDNAANCKSAGGEVEKVYKHIFWSPCCVHTLNLICKDLSKELYWLRDTYKAGKNVVKYFLNHTHALAMFRENSKLELLKVAKTRFASYYILLRRLADCREALATTISLNSWRDWVKQGNEHTRNLGQTVVETIRSDKFWDDVESILAFTKSIFLMVKFCDGEGPKMEEIYEKMDNMLGEIKDIMVENPYSHYFDDVEKIVLQRWDKMTIPLHCLGFALSPQFYDSKYLSQKAPGGLPRKAPNKDKEVIRNMVATFERITKNEEEKNLLRKQFAIFHMKKGLFELPEAHVDAVTMDAIEWWSTYGSETPELAEVAKKVLSQPISSSSAERNWSTYSYIHNVKRNRLNNKRADKLVYVHSNIRLVSRSSQSYKQGPYKKWDINPESSNLESSLVRLDDTQWENLYEDVVDQDKGKRQRLD